MLKKHLKMILFLALGIQISFAQNIQLSDPLPMDPAVKVGKLDNGLTYFIRKNEQPKNRAELRLVVKAGSILESESQLGLAHFMEHMNFNGTKNFPKNELVDFLQKSGIKFGADLNAYTSFDETVYMLPVPSDNRENFEKFMSVLADWSGNATLDADEIEKERGVILEESRIRKGAQQRIQEQLIPALLKGSLYAERLPIGKEEIIQNAPREEFIKFKTDWYRPNLQAIVAVGDFDPVEVEALIKKLFSGFKNPANEKERIKYSVPLSGATDAMIITDKEQPYNMINIMYIHPEANEITGNDRRNAIIRSLFNQMISKRLTELTQSANPPYLAGLSSYSGFLAGMDALNAVAVAKGNDVEGAMIAVLDENNRAARYGFTQAELDRAKLEYKTSVEKQLTEKDKTPSGSYVNELVQGFLKDLVMTEIEFDKAFVDQYLEGITVEDVNTFTKNAITDENIFLVLIGSEKDKDSLPTVDRLKELLKDTGSEITAYEEEEIADSLLDEIPGAGQPVSQMENTEVGVTTLTFANGVKVLLKPTDFKNDEILFYGSRWGGTSRYSDADYDNASLASAIASQSGNGSLSNTQLSKFLTGKLVSANATVGSLSESISGSSTTKDLETALQLVYNKFTNNQLDEEVVKGFMNSQIGFLKTLEASPTPENIYSDSLSYILSNYHFRGRPMTSQRFENVDYNRAMDIFKERFSDASGFDFTFVGNFDVEEIKPLLATYLGSLPADGSQGGFKDLGIHPPKGKVNKTIYKGTEDKATVTLVLPGTFKNKKGNEELMLDALGQALQIKLTEILREEEGGVYSPSARIMTNNFPKPVYQLRVGFGAAPANVEKLIALTLNEIEKIKKNGVSAEDIQKYVSNERLKYETNLKNNNYWLSSIVTKNQKGQDLNTILDKEKDWATITPKSTKKAAKKYLKTKNFIRVVLLPEN